MSKQPTTYKAPHAVYVDNILHPASEPFTTTATPGEKWEKISAGEKVAAEAASKTIDTQPSLDDLDTTALKALAATKNVATVADGKTLSRKDLIAAIKAVDEPKL